jgi:hypothetical protein
MVLETLNSEGETALDHARKWNILTSGWSIHWWDGDDSFFSPAICSWFWLSWSYGLLLLLTRDEKLFRIQLCYSIMGCNADFGLRDQWAWKSFGLEYDSLIHAPELIASVWPFKPTLSRRRKSGVPQICKANNAFVKKLIMQPVLYVSNRRV